MNTAICLSGLARTFKQTYPAFARNIVGPLAKRGNVDVFISVWDKTDIGALAPQPLAQETPVDLNELARLYQPRFMEVESFDALRAAFLLANYTARQCPVPAIVRNGILLAMPAQYKVLKCNALKRLYEDANGMRYDLVIRTRLDFEIAPLRVDELDPTKVNCLYDNGDLIGDYFYAAGSGVMDAACDVFTNYHYLLNIEGSDMGPERNLKNHANQRGLSTKVLQDHAFALVRDTRRDGFRWNAEKVDYEPFDRPVG